MMKVAIIGSNGFIGRHLTERLLKEPETKLFLFGRSDSGIFGDSLPYKKINFFDHDALTKDFADIDVIYYLVSETIPATSWHKPAIEIEKKLKSLYFFSGSDLKTCRKKNSLCFKRRHGVWFNQRQSGRSVR